MSSSPFGKKFGYVVIIGRSNVGKSTLINALIGSKITITSPKPQTTRLPIHGILSNDEGQIVFVDTPGILKGAKDPLSKSLAASVTNALSDVEMLLYVVDPTRSIGDEEKTLLRSIEKFEQPKILVINKMDIPNPPFKDYYMDLKDKFSDVIEISAKNGTHIKTLIKNVFHYLPFGEPQYPEFQLTNQSNETWLSELIREKLFLRLRQEVPYTTSVTIEEIAERENGMQYIKAVVYTTDDRYKRMIIGKGGRGIREIGQSTRKELETVMNKKIFLDLEVEVNPHWMNQFEM